MLKKSLAVGALVLFTASSGALACSAHQKSVQSMKPTTVADGGQTVVPPAETTKTQ